MVETQKEVVPQLLPYVMPVLLERIALKPDTLRCVVPHVGQAAAGCLSPGCACARGSRVTY
jgi:hypothetical protein